MAKNQSGSCGGAAEFCSGVVVDSIAAAAARFPVCGDATGAAADGCKSWPRAGLAIPATVSEVAKLEGVVAVATPLAAREDARNPCSETPSRFDRVGGTVSVCTVGAGVAADETGGLPGDVAAEEFAAGLATTAGVGAEITNCVTVRSPTETVAAGAATAAVSAADDD